MFSSRRNLRSMISAVFDTLEDRRLLCVLSLNPNPIEDIPSDSPPELNLSNDVNSNPDIVVNDGSDLTLTNPGEPQTFFVDSSRCIDDPNMAPAQDDYYYGDFNQPIAVTADMGLLANDNAPDGASLTFSIVDQPQSGTLLLNSDGSFTYTPNADFAGCDSFTYTFTDGTDVSNIATVNLEIYPALEVPDPSYFVVVNNTLTVDKEIGLLNFVVNSTGNAIAITVVDAPQNGTLQLNDDGSFIYTPNADYEGDDWFTFTLTDGIYTSNIAYADVAVLKPQSALDDGYFAPSDQPLVVSAEIGLLSNDVNLTGAVLTVSLVDAPTNGQLLLNSDGSFLYIPGADFQGEDSFTYAIDGTDQVASVSLSYCPIYYASAGEVGGDQSDDSTDFTTDEDTTLTLDGNLGDSGDGEFDINQAYHGQIVQNEDGTLTYTPDENYSGKDYMVYTLGGNVMYKTLDVKPVNDAPVGKTRTIKRGPESDITVNPGDCFQDADGDQLTYEIAKQPKHGAAVLNDNGTPDDTSDDFIEYIPKDGFYGQDVFTLTANDGTDETSSLVTVQTKRVGLKANSKNPAKKDLIVLGTEGDDTIKLLTNKKGKVKVFLNGASQGLFKPTGQIIVKALAGNDVVDASKLKRSVQIYGGDGNDQLYGSTVKTSKIYGGKGNDFIQGKYNNDNLFKGGAGKNVIEYYAPYNSDLG